MRLASLIGLLGVGYNRIMLAHDTVACWVGRKNKGMRKMFENPGNWKLTHVSENIVPALRKAGVGEDAIDTLLVKNPRDYFVGPDGRPTAVETAPHTERRPQWTTI